MATHETDFLDPEDWPGYVDSREGNVETELDSIALVAGDENDIIRRLFNELNEKNVSLTSLELSLAHFKIQVAALLSELQNSKSHTTHLQLEQSKAAQDFLLLQSDMKLIANFEDQQYKFDSEHIRGEILQVANTQIDKLTQTLQDVQAAHDQDITYMSSQLLTLSHENEGLHQQNKHLTEQLATRTIMYNGLVREGQRTHQQNDALFSDKERENIILRAQLEQMTAQYESCRSEKTELEIQYREVVQVKSSLEVELEDSKQAKIQLQEELDTATFHNHTLQGTVQSLQGSDYEEVQTRFAEQVQQVRSDGRAVEDDLRRQLQEARLMLTSVAENRESLIEEVVRLKGEVESQSQLLDELNHSSSHFGGQHSTSHMNYAAHTLSQSHAHASSHHHHPHNLLLDGHVLPDEDFSMLSSVNDARISNNHRYAPNALRQSTESVRSTHSADSADSAESGSGSGSWSIGMLANGRDGDHNGDAHVLQASQEGLPPHTLVAPGIAATHPGDDDCQDDVMERVMSVLDALTETLGQAAAGADLSKLALIAINQLAATRIVEVHDGMRGELSAAVDRLVKRLVTAVHVHLTQQEQQEEPPVSIHPSDHTQTKHTPYRVAHEVSLQDTSPQKSEVSLGRDLAPVEEELRDIKEYLLKQRMGHVALRRGAKALVDLLQTSLSGTDITDAAIQAAVEMVRGGGGGGGGGGSHAEGPNVTASQDMAENTITVAQLEARLLSMLGSQRGALTERAMLQEQLSFFDKEVGQLQVLAANNLTLGRHQAAEDYESVVHSLEAQLLELREQLAQRPVVEAPASKPTLEILRLQEQAHSQATAELHTLTLKLEQTQQALSTVMSERDALNERLVDLEAQTAHALLHHTVERVAHQEESAAARQEVLAHQAHAQAVQESLSEYKLRVSELQQQIAGFSASTHTSSSTTNTYSTNNTNTTSSAVHDHDALLSEASLALTLTTTTTLQQQVSRLELEKTDLLAQLQALTGEAETSRLHAQAAQVSSDQLLVTLRTACAEQTQRIHVLNEKLALRDAEKRELEAEILQFQQLNTLLQRRIDTQQAQHSALQKLQQLQQDTQTQSEVGVGQNNLEGVSSVRSSTSQQPFVLQQQFQETVTALQLQMEAVMNVNELVADNIRVRISDISHEDRAAAEELMLSLGDKLEQKISAVNTQLNVFREQQLVQQQQEQEARELALLEARRSRESLPGPTPPPAPPLSVPSVPTVPVSEHQASLQAEREVARQLQQRLQELEGTNAQLMEHNMAMMKGTLLLQQQQQQQNQHQQHYVHESAEEKDNGSVFSIEKSAYQEQVTLLSQQIAVIEQQRMQIDHYEKGMAALDVQTQQIRSHCQQKIAKLKASHADKVRKQKADYDAELTELVSLVKEECANILQEVYELIRQDRHEREDGEIGEEGVHRSTHSTPQYSHTQGTAKQSSASRHQEQHQEQHQEHHQGQQQHTHSRFTSPVVVPPVPPPPPPPPPAASSSHQSSSVLYAVSRDNQLEEEHAHADSSVLHAQAHSAHVTSHTQEQHRYTSDSLQHHQQHHQHDHSIHTPVAAATYHHQQHHHHHEMMMPRSREFELRHSADSSLPVRAPLPPPALGASPARKTADPRATAAIIAAHRRPPADLMLPHAGEHKDQQKDHREGRDSRDSRNSRELNELREHPSSATPGIVSRLLSSVTSLQSRVSANSAASSIDHSVLLAGPKPSYANPTVAYTSKHRQSAGSVVTAGTSIHPPGTSGDINQVSKKRASRSSSATNNSHSRDSAIYRESRDSSTAAPTAAVADARPSPPSRRSSRRSAHTQRNPDPHRVNTSNNSASFPIDRVVKGDIFDTQRMVEWSRAADLGQHTNNDAHSYRK